MTTDTSHPESLFLQDIIDLMRKDWGPLPLPTTRSCLHAFRILARFGSCGYKLLIRRRRNFPYRTFDLLKADVQQATAEELASTASCMLDPWTERFLDSCRATEEGLTPEESTSRLATTLQSEDVQARLLAVASAAHVDTVSTERTHATNARRARGQHSALPMSLDDLAAWQVLRSAGSEFATRAAGKRAKTAKRHSDAAKQSTARPRGCRTINPWQGFISERTSSATARPTTKQAGMVQLSKEYIAMTPEGRKRAAEVGEAFSILGKRKRQTWTERRHRAQAAGHARLLANATRHTAAGGADDTMAHQDLATMALSNTVEDKLVDRCLAAEREARAQRLQDRGSIGNNTHTRSAPSRKRHIHTSSMLCLLREIRSFGRRSKVSAP